MSFKILNGKWLSSLFQEDIAAEVSTLESQYGRKPGLAVILVGDNPASQSYVKRKGKVAAGCGFQTFDSNLSATAPYEEVRDQIKSYNTNNEVDGILLQLPLPDSLKGYTNQLIREIDPQKDVDGLHPFNQGLLLGGEGELRSCTPLGVMKMIDLALSEVTPDEDPQNLPQKKTDAIAPVDLSGKEAVVIGRSVLVGKPVSFLLLERNATVTMAHSRTKDIKSIVSRADIVVAAVGIANFVKEDWIKEGAIVVDVGINRLPTGKLCGDVDYESVAPKSSAITPVPGGVGLMTVIMLMNNTLTAYKKRSSS